MQTEIEAKFLNVDHDVLRAVLKKAGAQCTCPMRLMRRKNYDFAGRTLEKRSNGWVRVRDEGNKVTLAYKQLDDRGVKGTKEISVIVKDFETTCKFLELIGMEEQSYQETRRESWVLDDAEIELDEWPWIKPFIEIEAPNERMLFAVAKTLGFQRADAVHGSVEIAYQAEYRVTEEEVDHWKVITFGDVPGWLKVKKK